VPDIVVDRTRVRQDAIVPRFPLGRHVTRVARASAGVLLLGGSIAFGYARPATTHVAPPHAAAALTTSTGLAAPLADGNPPSIPCGATSGPC
jgi:hypothetical protein